MIDTIQCNIHGIIVHEVGNKMNNEKLKISKSELMLGNSIVRMLLLKYFTSSFKIEEYYNLHHITQLELNEVYSYATAIFDDPASLYEQSINLAKHLYQQSIHPKIKAGEFYVVYFKNFIINDESVDAIGLFKSENKDTFLKVYSRDERFEIESDNGINVNKLDKGCIIFNTEKENGYLVAVVDNTNKNLEAKYWTENFLHVRPRKDSYNQTQNMLLLCKSFISQLPKDKGKVNKAVLINKSVEALKSNSVYIDKFAKQVFEHPELVSQFIEFKKIYQQRMEIEVDNFFESSIKAIKNKSVRQLSVIKLDKNFDINIHGGKEFVERGYDEKRGMYYYQLFFREEK